MVSVRTAAVAAPVGDVAAELGEGPYWVPEDDCLLWVDIRREELHRTYFPSGETVTIGLVASSHQKMVTNTSKLDHVLKFAHAVS